MDLLSAKRKLLPMGTPRDSGGGSGSATSTQVSDLPDWAKGTAQKTLGQAEALTMGVDPVTGKSTNPYQKYGEQRLAGFQPMQEQAFGAAQNLQPSMLGAQAGQMAGAATYGALNTGYNPYQTGQFTSQAASQYMNPYLEQAMAPQLREAQRASEMQKQGEQARAVQQGAFGGSRQGIVEAERQRNLGMLQGDIRAKGYQSAFDQAQQQFAREQQLQEQSRQYGAGLGMQGLQTALQGAGMMGTLGGQQFGQAKDVIGLQSTLGAQQQAQQQAGLTQNYQDFLNQQRYPYQQLEFMSNILRGTPMGTVNTLYGGQPNTLGQLAGIGAGLYGTFGKAEGGSVSSYAEGGVTSEANVADILGKLSDQQLSQARVNALSQRDVERVRLIDEELAERASIKGGLGGAFNQLPQSQQEAVTDMAGGGIVAFAGGGDVERYQAGGSPVYYPYGAPEAGRFTYGGEEEPRPARVPGEPMSYGEQMGSVADLIGAGLRGVGRFATKTIPGAAAESVKHLVSAPGYGLDRLLNPPSAASDLGPVPGTSDKTPVLAGVATSAPVLTAGKSGTEPKADKKPAPKSVTAAAKAVGAAAEQTTGVNRTSMEDAFKEGLRLVKDERGDEDSKRMTELINRLSKSDAPDKMEMLANFGFRMAAAASKPGARFLSAAAEGAQVVPEMMAQSKKDAKEAARLGATLEMEKLKLDAANRRGDRTAALQHAQNIRIMEGQEAQMAESKRHNIATERNQAAQIAATEKRIAAAGQARRDQYTAIKSQLARSAMTQATKDWGDPFKKELKQQYPSLQAYQKALFQNMWAQSMPQLELLGATDKED